MFNVNEKPRFNLFMLPDLQRIVEEWHRPHVQKGAAWLDEYEPGWVQKIIPEDLDLSSTEVCICGQVFGDYAQRPHAVYEAFEYGFCNDNQIDDFFRGEDSGNAIYGLSQLVNMSYAALDRLWLDEVWWRSDYRQSTI